MKYEKPRSFVCVAPRTLVKKNVFFDSETHLRPSWSNHYAAHFLSVSFPWLCDSLFRQQFLVVFRGQTRSHRWFPSRCGDRLVTFVLETVTQLARSRFDTFDSYRPKIVTRRNRHFCGGNRKTYRGARVYLGEKKYLNVTKNKLSPARRHLAIRGPVRVSRVRRGCVGWKRFFFFFASREWFRCVRSLSWLSLHPGCGGSFVEVKFPVWVTMEEGQCCSYLLSMSCDETERACGRGGGFCPDSSRHLGISTNFVAKQFVKAGSDIFV